jgi:hypothetical protein
MQARPNQELERWQPALIALGVLIVLVSLVNWGGTATPGPKFVLGVSVLLGLIAAFVGLGWWLLASRLPVGAHIQPIAGAGTIRAFAAAVACSSGLLFISGGLWDEIWHRKYGGFGQDFLWPPHLLLYSSIALLALLACGSMIVLALRGAGGLRERVRAEPLLGLIALTATYLIASLPSDELWHRIYGRDITAWSLPHVILVSGIAGVMLASVPLALSSVVRATSWRGLRRLQAGEVVALTLVAWATTMFLQIGTAEWDGIRVIGQGSGNAYRDAFWQRPEWLYPVVILTIAMFAGRLAQQVTRRVGTATMVGLIVLAFRLLLIEANSARGQIGFTPHLLILSAMVALDLWVWLMRDRLPVVGNLISSLVFLAVALPVIPNLLIYPRINADTLPGMIIMGGLMGLAAGLAGSGLGGMLARFGVRKTSETARVQAVRTEGFTALGGLVLAAVVVMVTMSVAVPPLVK